MLYLCIGRDTKIVSDIVSYLYLKRIGDTISGPYLYLKRIGDTISGPFALQNVSKTYLWVVFLQVPCISVGAVLPAPVRNASKTYLWVVFLQVPCISVGAVCQLPCGLPCGKVTDVSVQHAVAGHSTCYGGF